MKIDKTLLQAIFIGASLGAVSSCSLQDTVETEFVHENCDEKCAVEGHNDSEGSDGGTYNCPGCGMG